jgi:hypothetical protein
MTKETKREIGEWVMGIIFLWGGRLLVITAVEVWNVKTTPLPAVVPVATALLLSALALACFAIGVWEAVIKLAIKLARRGSTTRS